MDLTLHTRSIPRECWMHSHEQATQISTQTRGATWTKYAGEIGDLVRIDDCLIDLFGFICDSNWSVGSRQEYKVITLHTTSSTHPLTGCEMTCCVHTWTQQDTNFMQLEMTSQCNVPLNWFYVTYGANLGHVQQCICEYSFGVTLSSRFRGFFFFF